MNNQIIEEISNELKIKYPLEGINDMDKEKCKKLETMLKEGLK